MKELTDYASGSIQNETSSNYSSLVGSSGATGDDLMSGIVGLWHLNEASAGTAPGAKDFWDTSGGGRHGIAFNGVSYGGTGKLGSAAIFNDSTDSYIETGLKMSDHSLEDAATYSGWVLPRDLGAWTPFLTGGSDAKIAIELNGGVFFLWVFTDQGWENVASTTPVPLNTWSHVAASVVGQNAKIYINGILEGTSALMGLPESGTTNFYIGHSEAGSGLDRSWRGQIDEVAIWSRALHENEIKQLYQRGASRLKFQVRTCNDSACAGETWKGPDGTSSTYFSELNNNSVPLAMTGDVKPTLPSMLFSNFTSPPSANQYFQYRSIFETDSSDVALGPELKSVSVDPVHYPTEATLIGNNAVPFLDLSGFSETLGAGACSSGVGYNLSLDKTNWKYWNGSAWVAANGTVAQSNAASVIQTNAATFGSMVGSGSVYFKAFLQSSGTSKCELDNIQLSGNK